MDLSMSLNCSANPTSSSQMNSAEFTKDMAADYMDMAADFFEEQQEAIRESDQSDWEFIDSNYDDLAPWTPKSMSSTTSMTLTT